LLAAAAFQYFRPLPVTAASFVLPATQRLGTAPALPWPAQGEAALFVDGVGDVGSSGGQSPVPMASTAKLMTALVVLEDHPLALNEPGPTITVTRADVSTYLAERNQNESVVPVAAGEQLSEYQLLQGLLLPSASNFADMLANWDLGGVAAFVGRMNARAAALGMGATHYADVSGFSAQSVSIPSDLIKLGQMAMRLPAFAQIVAQSQATLPVAGVVRNLDTLLGQGGVVGIKTGHTDQAGGCFVMAADLTIDGVALRVYGAVLGQPNALAGAFKATSTLLQGLTPALHLRPVVRRDDVIARYRTGWDEAGAIVASQSVAWVLPDGTAVSRQVKLDDLPAMVPAGTRVGTLFVTAGSHQGEVPLVMAAAINGPDAGWRLTRGF
jgi:serine-type D-Ala-D-Ala carboxypeptidase (penicillin-binding protein 5/6)